MSHPIACPFCDQREKDLERLHIDGENLRALIRQFDAAIRRIAYELTGQACGGVDTADEINPETGEPYGPGGHTGWLLATEARKLREERDRLRGLVKHCWIHSNYEDCGYRQMTTEEKALYDSTVDRKRLEGKK